MTIDEITVKLLKEELEKIVEQELENMIAIQKLLTLNKIDSEDLKQFLNLPKMQILHRASMKGHLKIVSFLLEKGADPNAICNEKSMATPIHFAVTYNQFKIAKLLIDKKADVNLADCQGKTPLHKAIIIAFRTSNKVEFSGASTIVKTNPDVETNKLIIQLLINSGAKILDAPDKDGLTPLSYAAINYANYLHVIASPHQIVDFLSDLREGNIVDRPGIELPRRGQYMNLTASQQLKVLESLNPSATFQKFGMWRDISKYTPAEKTQYEKDNRIFINIPNIVENPEIVKIMVSAISSNNPNAKIPENLNLSHNLAAKKVIKDAWDKVFPSTAVSEPNVKVSESSITH